MLGLGEDLLDGTGLDDLPLGHHADAVRDLPHDAEIVRDEQNGHSELGLQVFEELQDLRLHRDVERGRGLVGDEKVRFVRERHCNHHALALAARELVRIGVEPFFCIADADLIEKLQHASADFRFRPAAVHVENFADLALDRVQAG